jgi:hypothetical protein
MCLVFGLRFLPQPFHPSPTPTLPIVYLGTPCAPVEPTSKRKKQSTTYQLHDGKVCDTGQAADVKAEEANTARREGHQAHICDAVVAAKVNLYTCGGLWDAPDTAVTHTHDVRPCSNPPTP